MASMEIQKADENKGNKANLWYSDTSV